MNTTLAVRVSTKTKIIIGIALGLGALGLGFAIAPRFTNQSWQNNQTYTPPPAQNNAKNNVQAAQGDQKVSLFSESDVIEGASLREVSLNSPTNSQRRVLSTDSLYSQPQPIISNGPMEEKYNFAFLAPTNFSDDEVAQIARLFYARGLQMYTPFREHWSLFNVYVVRVNQSDSDDPEYRDELVKQIPYPQIQKVIFLSKTASRKLNSTIPSTLGLAYAHYNGDVVITLTGMYEMKKWMTELEGFDFSGWSDSLDVRLWNFQQKQNLVHVLMHELGHAIAGLADEYITSSGPSVLYEFMVNCQYEVPNSWWQNIGKKDTAYSQYGKVTVTAGVFAGCSYTNANQRSTEESVMTSRFDYSSRSGLQIFPHFGYINSRALLSALSGKHFKEGLSPSCGGGDKGYQEPACGLTTPNKSDGEECFPFYQVKKIPLADGTTSNLCEPCPEGTSYGPNGKCNGEPIFQINCPIGYEYNQALSMCTKYCGGRDQNVCPDGVINTYAGCDFVAEPLVNYLNTCKPCGQLDQPVCSSGECRVKGLVSIDGFCKMCGGRGQRICPTGQQCLSPYQRDPWGASFCCSSGERFDSSQGPEGRCIPLTSSVGPGSGTGPNQGRQNGQGLNIPFNPGGQSGSVPTAPKRGKKSGGQGG